MGMKASAIPFPAVKVLFGSYLVYVCSNVNGCEGTACCLSLKLVQQLQGQSQNPINANDGLVFRRVSTKVDLDKPIRYVAGNPVESCLHKLLCLDTTDSPNIVGIGSFTISTVTLSSLVTYQWPNPLEYEWSRWCELSTKNASKITSCLSSWSPGTELTYIGRCCRWKCWEEVHKNEGINFEKMWR